MYCIDNDMHVPFVLYYVYGSLYSIHVLLPMMPLDALYIYSLLEQQSANTNRIPSQIPIRVIVSLQIFHIPHARTTCTHLQKDESQRLWHERALGRHQRQHAGAVVGEVEL